MKEIKVALIGGSGLMGRAHSLGYAVAPIMAQLDVVIRRSVLVDVDAARAEEAARNLGWERASDDWRAVVADPDIDVVDIVTPPGLHREIALAAIANGKHVFCEKPLANDDASAVEMWQAARDAGVVNQVGFNYRHISAITFIKTLLDQGKLGVPMHFRGEYLTDALFFIDDFGWRGSKETGGSGAVGDIGSHIIDVAQYLCGPVTRVAALKRTKDRDDKELGWLPEAATKSGTYLDDASAFVAEFENGAMGTFSAGLYSSGRKNALTFSIDGSLGGVAFDWNNPDQLQVSYVGDPEDHSGLRTVEITGAHPDVWYPVPGLGQGYLDGMATQLSRFVAAVASGAKSSHPDFESAARVQQVATAVIESAETGSWVTVRGLGGDAR
jgi:predicted dehydrogenase